LGYFHGFLNRGTCGVDCCFVDVGSWREGGGRSMPAPAPPTDDDRSSYTPPSASAPTAASSEDEDTPQQLQPAAAIHSQSQAAVMAHMMRPSMGPGPPRMGPGVGPGGPMMYGAMMPPFVSDAC